MPIAQSAARSTSRVGQHGPGHRTLGLAQGDQRRAEVGGIGGDVEGVHAVADPVRPALPQIVRDPVEPLVPRRREAAAAEQDRLRDPIPLQPLRRRAHPGVLALAEDDAGPALRRALQQLVAEAHRPNFPFSAAATAGCTSPLTSPP